MDGGGEVMFVGYSTLGLLKGVNLGSLLMKSVVLYYVESFSFLEILHDLQAKYFYSVAQSFLIESQKHFLKMFAA